MPFGIFKKLEKRRQPHRAENILGPCGSMLAGLYHFGAGPALRERQVGLFHQRTAQQDHKQHAQHAAHGIMINVQSQ